MKNIGYEITKRCDRGLFLFHKRGCDRCDIDEIFDVNECQHCSDSPDEDWWVWRLWGKTMELVPYRSEINLQALQRISWGVYRDVDQWSLVTTGKTLEQREREERQAWRGDVQGTPLLTASQEIQASLNMELENRQHKLFEDCNGC